MIVPEGSEQLAYVFPRLSLGHGYFNATVAPTANNDVTQSFLPDSFWYKETYPYRLWICTDSTTGAAVWREIPLTDFRSTRTLFDHYADATTTGTGTVEETLYIDSIPVRTLFENGDKIVAEYGGIFDATNDSTDIFIRFAGSLIFSTAALGKSITADGVDWKLDATIIRVSNTDIRATSILWVTGVTVAVQYNTLTSLVLDSNAYDLELSATTATIGDITAKMGTARLIPAATDVAAKYVTVSAVLVTVSAEGVTVT